MLAIFEWSGCLNSCKNIAAPPAPQRPPHVSCLYFVISPERLPGLRAESTMLRDYGYQGRQNDCRS
jgi:hypothetical protein